MTRTHFGLSPEDILEGLRRNDRRIVADYYGYLRERAFGIFCRAHEGSPTHLAMEDCFSQAFMTLLEKVRSGSYQHRNLDAFALGIVRYCFSDARKKLSRHTWLSLSESPEPADEASTAHSTAASLFDEYSHIRLLQWYFRQEPLSQRILDLRTQGYRHEEIAEVLPLAPGTVRNRFSKMMREARAVARA